MDKRVLEGAANCIGSRDGLLYIFGSEIAPHKMTQIHGLNKFKKTIF